MVNTREELIDALTEAAELEHGLLLQYLFASFSLKRRTDEGITHRQQAMLVEWERAILSVAHEEMLHLGQVCNLLSAIGGAPQFRRPNFPQPYKQYYPFDFSLTPFSLETAYRFVCFELPRGEEPPFPPPSSLQPKDDGKTAFRAPDPLLYSRIGELYDQIAQAFSTMSPETLFIGPNANQDDDWDPRFSLSPVTNVPQALAAINQIIIEGEGAPANRADSHYDIFCNIYLQLQKEIEQQPDFAPARQVSSNPQTRMHRDAKGEVALIEYQPSRQVAELFSSVYNSMLLMLMQYYSYNGENEEQRLFLRDNSRRLMSGIIRPLAEVLTELPLRGENDDLRAGPGFELYTDLRLSTQQTARGIILRERFADHVESAAALAGYHPRLAAITETLVFFQRLVNESTL